MRLLADIRFGPLMIDQPDLDNPGLELARGVLPRARGYDPLPGILGYGTNRLPKRCTGAFSAKDENDTSYLYAGTDDKLFQLTATTWVDSSRVTPAYSPVVRWDWTKFGKLAIAAHLDDKPQKITLGGANFADLTATNVQGASIAALRGFVVLGNVKDDDGHNPFRVRWGPLNDPEGDWAPSVTTQANFNDLRTVGGRVVKVTGGEFGMVFRERSTYRMTYTGSGPTFWQFDEVDPGIGCISFGSVIQHGARIFFFSEDGPRMTVGDASQPIGEERVDLSILSDLDQSHLDRVTGEVYTNEQIIVWAWPGAGNTDGRPNRLGIYNYATDRWSSHDESLDILFRAATPFRSIDGFDDDPTFGGTQSPPIYASIDDIPGSLDDRAWAGGAFQLGAIDSTQDLAFFNGPPVPATFITGEYQLTAGRRTFIDELRSLANQGAGIRVSVGYRASQADPIVWTPPVAPTTEGFMHVRNDARFHRFELNVDSGFTDAVGLQVFGEPSGGR